MVIRGPIGQIQDNQALLAQAKQCEDCAPRQASALESEATAQRSPGGDSATISDAAQAALDREIASTNADATVDERDANNDSAAREQTAAAGERAVSDQNVAQGQAEDDAQAASNAESDAEEAAAQDPGRPRGQDGEPLDDQEALQVQELQRRDQEVRAHEQAHIAAAGGHARGGPKYSYEQGPDGRRYAVGGEVPIDVSKESTPEDTITKMQTVRRAALAPAEPSAADRAIASAASQKESEARAEIAAERMQSDGEESGNDQAVNASEASSRGGDNEQHGRNDDSGNPPGFNPPDPNDQSQARGQLLNILA